MQKEFKICRATESKVVQMKIKLETYNQKRERLSKWHKRFAFFPVILDGGIIWLSYYWRREVKYFFDYYFEYSLEDKNETP